MTSQALDSHLPSQCSAVTYADTAVFPFHCFSFQARCARAIEQVDYVLTQWHAHMQALTLSESNAEVLAEGVVSSVC